MHSLSRMLSLRVILQSVARWPNTFEHVSRLDAKCFSTGLITKLPSAEKYDWRMEWMFLCRFATSMTPSIMRSSASGVTTTSSLGTEESAGAWAASSLMIKTTSEQLRMGSGQAGLTACHCAYQMACTCKCMYNDNCECDSSLPGDGRLVAPASPYALASI